MDTVAWLRWQLEEADPRSFLRPIVSAFDDPRAHCECRAALSACRRQIGQPREGRDRKRPLDLERLAGQGVRQFLLSTPMKSLPTTRACPLRAATAKCFSAPPSYQFAEEDFPSQRCMTPRSAPVP